MPWKPHTPSSGHQNNTYLARVQIIKVLIMHFPVTFSLCRSTSAIFFPQCHRHSFYIKQERLQTSVINLYGLRQQMEKLKFLNWMVASIPRIQPALNFCMYFWFVKCYSNISEICHILNRFISCRYER
jgi:hypothetical protein